MCKRNAVILAAGMSSRFAPLSYEKPKSLWSVRGEILIERQIQQLCEAGISDIVVVTGYQQEKFAYLAEKYSLKLLYNEEYAKYNNLVSLWKARDYLNNTFICSSDNYFTENPFVEETEQAYYAAVYAAGKTLEWCLTTDEEQKITSVQIGGENSWYMMGHVFFTEAFSRAFIKLMEQKIQEESYRLGLWEELYRQFIPALPPLYLKKYADHMIYEFDTVADLAAFDTAYLPRVEG